MTKVLVLSEVQDLVIPLPLWHSTFFVSKHYISLEITTLHHMLRTELHILILHLHSEKPICNLQHFLFPFFGHSDWRLAVRMNLLLIFVCVVAGGPSCPFIVLRLWELITELTSSFFQSNVTYFRFIQSTRQYSSLIVYWNDWWLVRKILVLFIYFVNLFVCVGVLRLWRSVETLTGLTCSE